MKRIIIILIAINFSCSKTQKKNIQLSQTEMSQIELVVSYFEEEFQKEEIYYCSSFDLFSPYRFLKYSECVEYFDDIDYDSVNSRFLNRKNDFFESLNSIGKKTLLLSMSGFEKEVFIVTINNVEDNYLDDDLCERERNNESIYLITIKDGKIKNLYEEEVFYW